MNYQGDGELRIAYIGRHLPKLSETFVVREIRELRRQGISVLPVSLFNPSEEEHHPEDADLAAEAVVAWQPLNPFFWLLHIVYAVLHAPRYFKCLWRYCLGADLPWNIRGRMLGQFLMSPRLAHIARKKNLDHLHAHFGNSPGAVAMMAAEMAGISFSFTGHAIDLFKENWLLAEKVTAAACVITVSEFNKAYILNEVVPEGVQPTIHIVRAAFDVHSVAQQKPEKRDEPVVISVGRLIPMKGIDTLIAAAALLKKRNCRLQVRIIGDGPEMESLQQMTVDRGVADRVTLLGAKFQSELMEEYDRADMFALPCRVINGDADNLPVVIIEAMAHGLPCVSTDIRAIPEIVKDKQTGMVVQPDSPEMLADALEALARDPELARRLGEAGRRLVENEFDIRITGQQLAKIFREIKDTKRE